MSLQVDDLRVYYRTLRGNVRALDGVTFTVADGEIMALVGESGCGKSTLAKSLIRLDGRMWYVSGKATLDGARLPVDDQEKMVDFRFRKVSLIPQYAMSALNPIRRVGKMISDLLGSRGISYPVIFLELRRRLEMVGLDVEVLDRYPIELSGGMKQRLVLVLATLLNPSLLIADEVTSALDVSTQRAVAEALVQFRDQRFVGKMIFVTHDVSLGYQIADTIMVMYAGKLAEKAPVDIAVHSPMHPYARMLVASLPEIGVRHTDRRLAGIPGVPPALLRPPGGCRFRQRCSVATAQCVREPPLVKVEQGHFVACWKVA